MLVQFQLSGLRRMPGKVSDVSLVRSEDQLLQWAVEAVEGSVEFAALCAATQDEYPRKLGGLLIQDIGRSEAQAYFRLSGLYQSAFAGEPMAVPAIVAEYHAAFSAAECLVTYLAPIEGVTIQEESLLCGSFKIRQLTREDLDDLLRNTVRRFFFPHAFVDTSQLADYWFLVVEERVPPRWRTDAELVLDARVPVVYSDFPAPVQTALERLAMFDWQRGTRRRPERFTDKPEPWDAPLLPHVPFVIRCSDCLTEWPERGPDLSTLQTEPFGDLSGEETSERPAVWLYLDEDETKKLGRFMLRCGTLLSRVERHRESWRFMEVAAGFLLKAFMTRGLERLLWNITAIEAAIGEQVDGGVTGLLIKRTVRILGHTNSEEKRVRKSLRALYDFRSALVHGKDKLPEQEIWLGHLTQARDLARGVVWWMLNFLAHAADSLPPGATRVPNREDLLGLLDLDPQNRLGTTAVLQNVPPGFPCVEDWA